MTDSKGIDPVRPGRNDMARLMRSAVNQCIFRLGSGTINTDGICTELCFISPVIGKIEVQTVGRFTQLHQRILIEDNVHSFAGIIKERHRTLRQLVFDIRIVADPGILDTGEIGIARIFLREKRVELPDFIGNGRPALGEIGRTDLHLESLSQRIGQLVDGRHGRIAAGFLKPRDVIEPFAVVIHLIKPLE